MAHHTRKCDELIGKLRQSDPALASTIESAIDAETTQRLAAEAEAESLRARLAALQGSESRADEVVMGLLASPSMNKSSCIDPDELKQALTAFAAQAHAKCAADPRGR